MFLGQYSSKCWGWKRRLERCLQPWWYSPKETNVSFPTGRRVIRSWQLSRQQKGGWEGVSDIRRQIELLVNQGNIPLHVPVCTKRRYEEDDPFLSLLCIRPQLIGMLPRLIPAL